MKKPVELCILAGGLSTRMGRDKARLRLGGKTLLAHVRQSARNTGLPVRVIRRDLVPRCGPLGGVYSALKTTKADAVLFLACDMPNISGVLLRALLGFWPKAVFTWQKDSAGFPFLLPREAFPLVEQLFTEKKFSLQNLARTVRAKKFRPGRRFVSELLNVNTPGEWKELREVFRRSARDLSPARLVN